MTKRNAKWLIAAAGAVVSGILFLKMVVDIFFVYAARGRSLKLLGGRKRDKAKRQQYENSWLKKQPLTSVSIQSEDGLKLRGHYLKHPEEKRIILCFHGWRGTWTSDFDKLAQWFYQEGSSLLLVEQRAQGESEGKYMGFGILERKDCCRWLDFVREMYADSEIPVYLAGVSMGAATVLMAAGEIPQGQVKGILADCGFSSAYDIVLRTGKNKFHVKEYPLMKWLNRRCRKKAGYALDEYTAMDSVSKTEIPVLFVHGDADDFVPWEMSKANYEACKGKKKLLLAEGARHCQSFEVLGDLYKDTVKEFFEWEKESRPADT